jgi:hypothetical protein
MIAQLKGVEITHDRITFGFPSTEGRLNARRKASNASLKRLHVCKHQIRSVQPTTPQSTRAIIQVLVANDKGQHKCTVKG